MKRTEKQVARALVDALDGATDAQIEAAAAQLVSLLVLRVEVHRVPRVIEALEDAWRERYGAATVTIETAHPLSTALKKRLETLAPGAELKEKVRPEIIGGAKLRIDETVIDGSIEGQLVRLKQVLANV